MENKRQRLMTEREVIKHLNQINGRKFVYITMLIDTPDFYYDIMDVYNKYRDIQVDNNTYIRNIISIPHEWNTYYWVEYTNNKISKIYPFIRAFDMINKINSDNEIIKNFIFDFNQVIEKYRKLGPDFQIKSNKHFDDKVTTYYLYIEIDNL